LGLTPSFLFIDLILSILTKQKSKKTKKNKNKTKNKKTKTKTKQKKSDRKKLQIFHFLCSRVAEGQG